MQNITTWKYTFQHFAGMFFAAYQFWTSWKRTAVAERQHDVFSRCLRTESSVSGVLVPLEGTGSELVRSQKVKRVCLPAGLSARCYFLAP